MFYIIVSINRTFNTADNTIHMGGLAPYRNALCLSQFLSCCEETYHYLDAQLRRLAIDNVNELGDSTRSVRYQQDR